MAFVLITATCCLFGSDSSCAQCGCEGNLAALGCGFGYGSGHEFDFDSDCGMSHGCGSGHGVSHDGYGFACGASYACGKDCVDKIGHDSHYLCGFDQG
mmetsp:Transcript_13429/g.42816  ORF Transcript_13429/g.42816 Transcript_13429/m.42816 type:complete len:98 (-) Transcript_13429:251-544(-)